MTKKKSNMYSDSVFQWNCFVGCYFNCSYCIPSFQRQMKRQMPTIDVNGRDDSTHCPFIKKVDDNKYICTIHDTKPKVCREFRCEWAYGVGEKGIPFKTERGWTDKAVQLGYG